MKITFLNPVGALGGAERVLLLAMRSLGSSLPAAELTLILLGDGPLRDEALALGVKVEVVALPATLARLGDSQFKGLNSAAAVVGVMARSIGSVPAVRRFLLRLKRAILGSKPDLIYSNGLKSHLALRLVGIKAVPVVWHLHDFYALRPIMARILKRSQKGVRCGIAISAAVARDTRQLLPKLPIEVVKNAVDTERFRPGVGSGEWLDGLAGLPVAPEGTIRVGLVATYANWKGHEVFLEALAKVLRTRGRLCCAVTSKRGKTPDDGERCNGGLGSAAFNDTDEVDIRGYIVGGPIYATAGSQVSLEGLRTHASRLGLESRIGFAPFQADTTRIYQSLDVVVHASTQPEPFGLTIAEAMACGRAVVVAAAGGAVELFSDGFDGVGHVPGDMESLAGAIERLVIDKQLRDRLGVRARETAVERFSEMRFGRELTEVVERSARREG